MAWATAARFPSSCSAVSRAWMPALTFSHTRGTPKNAVGCTCPITRTNCAASGQKCTLLTAPMAR
jgi:hypothetical protein